MLLLFTGPPHIAHTRTCLYILTSLTSSSIAGTLLWIACRPLRLSPIPVHVPTLALVPGGRILQVLPIVVLPALVFAPLGLLVVVGLFLVPLVLRSQLSPPFYLWLGPGPLHCARASVPRLYSRVYSKIVIIVVLIYIVSF